MITHQTSFITSSPDSEGPRFNDRRFVFSACTCILIEGSSNFYKSHHHYPHHHQWNANRWSVVDLAFPPLSLYLSLCLSQAPCLSPALLPWIFLPVSTYYSVCIHPAVTLTPGEVWKSHNKNAKCQGCRRNLQGEERRNSGMLFCYSAQTFLSTSRENMTFSAMLRGYIRVIPSAQLSKFTLI